MKTNCNIIQDLIPLYIDQVLSEESCKLVEEHLQECSICKEIYDNMRKETSVPNQIDEVSVVKKFTKNIKRSTISYVFVIVGFVLFWVCKYINYWNKVYLDSDLYLAIRDHSSIVCFDLIAYLLPWVLGFIFILICYFGYKDKKLNKGKLILLAFMIIFSGYRVSQDKLLRRVKYEEVIQKKVDNQIYIMDMTGNGDYLYKINVPREVEKMFKVGKEYNLYFVYNDNTKEGYLISGFEVENAEN